jgi:tetratricopeptide repeat protein 30
MKTVQHSNNGESITSRVYSCIRDGEFAKAIEIFDEISSNEISSNEISSNDSPSKSTLSLLAHCSYKSRDYARAAEFYEELVTVCPNEDEYQVYYVQSLVLAGAHHDACRVATRALTKTTSPEHSQRLRLLLTESQMKLGMLSSCNKTLSKCVEDDPATVLAMAAVDFADNKFANALDKYKIAKEMMGDAPMLLYYIALCRYQMGEYEEALEEVNELIELVGNGDSDELKQSFIVEAMNLKAAIFTETKQKDAAMGTMNGLNNLLTNDKNLDAISIHNEILSNIEVDPMQKLDLLLTDASFPPEALANLLLLCIKHGEEALALETFKANRIVAKELLSPDLFAYIQAAILSYSCPDEAYSMLDKTIKDMAPKMKAAKRKLDDAQTASSNNSTTRPSTSSIRPTTTARLLATSLTEAKQEFEALLENFIPIVMLQTKLFWDRKEYDKAENLLLDHSDYCMDNDEWNLNLGHTLFAQQNDKIEESIPHYEYVVSQWAEKGQLLKAPAVALANLCVSYIMAGRNEAAEAIMKAVDDENEQAALDDDSKSTYHSCIVNLVIGTLYCDKGNWEFGISRICKSVEPLEKNLCVDTWFYCKQCFLALASKVSKLMVALDAEMRSEIIGFLNDVEKLGGESVVLMEESEGGELVTISKEARQLKYLFLKLGS